jgi:hypothetical protein
VVTTVDTTVEAGSFISQPNSQSDPEATNSEGSPEPFAVFNERGELLKELPQSANAGSRQSPTVW